MGMGAASAGVPTVGVARGGVARGGAVAGAEGTKMGYKNGGAAAALAKTGAGAGAAAAEGPGANAGVGLTAGAGAKTGVAPVVEKEAGAWPGKLELLYTPEVDPLTGKPSPLSLEFNGSSTKSEPDSGSNQAQEWIVKTEPRSPSRVRASLRNIKDAAEGVPGDPPAAPRREASLLVPQEEASPAREDASRSNSGASDTQLAGTQYTFDSGSSQSYTEPDSDAINPLMFVSSSLAPSSPAHVADGEASQGPEDEANLSPAPAPLQSSERRSAAQVKRRHEGDHADTEPPRSRAIRAPVFASTFSVPR
ncbi:hypothetical protein FA95DRAFT_1577898 [Auriscalpium vulgare]|uniref:Uncharacterized protein n=1 Tax=Auriscalpium vulgare TaxID=40419 RepID=A0ACB8R4E1_9AGAM|nr:hypothetical protein FA95DRAFT_1577898 [Auriscalpium vulgare]